MKIDEIVFEIAVPIVDDFGFDLVDVEYLIERNERYLRVYIDKPSGITIDDCQQVSEKLGQILDLRDPISESYIFEVSSPGLERVLKKERDYIRYMGELIEIKFYKPKNGKKIIQGYLKDFNETELILEVEGKAEKYDRNDIAVAKRVLIL